LYGQANNFQVLKAAHAVKNEGIAFPILMGPKDEIKKMIKENALDLEDVEIIEVRNPNQLERRKRFAEIFAERRARKGTTYVEAFDLMMSQSYFGPMMVETGEADAFISGFTSKYADLIRPAVQVVGTKPKFNHIAGMYLLMTKQGPIFFADTTVNRKPDVQDLVDTTVLAAEEIMKFNIRPKIAMLSYSNFGSSRGGSCDRVRQAVKVLHEKHPDLIVDGEMQANFALNTEKRKNRFPFSKLADHDVNTLIFPNLSSGNIAYKMMQEIGGSEVIGPILMGINKPIHILQIGCDVREIVYMTAIAVVDAQCASDPNCG